MTTNRYTEDAALAHHGIAAENGLDYVRHEALVLSVCLGCASIIVAPDAATRVAMRAIIDWDAIDCCPDADRVNY
jgi:hypothetical protein